MSFEFTQPFDGTQPEVSRSEQEYVSSIFSSFVDNTLLSHVDMLNVIDAYPVDRSNPKTYLHLQKKLEENVALEITLNQSPNSPDVLKEICLWRNIDNRGEDTTYYRLGHDGVVRRFDLPAKRPELDHMMPDFRNVLFINVGGKPGQLTPNVDQEEIDASIKFNQDMSNVSENYKLEQNLGMNNQPIDFDELSTVMELVESAKAYKFEY